MRKRMLFVQDNIWKNVAVGATLWGRIGRPVCQQRRQCSCFANRDPAMGRLTMCWRWSPSANPSCALPGCIVSKRVDRTYRSCLCPPWIKVRNPATIAVQLEYSELWNR